MLRWIIDFMVGSAIVMALSGHDPREYWFKKAAKAHKRGLVQYSDYTRALISK